MNEDGFKMIADFPIEEETLGNFVRMTVEYREEDHTFRFIAGGCDEAGNDVSSEAYTTLCAGNGQLKTDSDFWMSRCLELAIEIDNLNCKGANALDRP